MFKKDIWRFGAVDVTDETGLTRHGIVRDIAPDGGLIVNFDYPRHRTELVPVSACVKPIAHFPPAVGNPVEVLYQYRRDQPWRWWPAQIVMLGSSNEYAGVNISFDDDTLQEIVPMERVRIPMPYVSQFRSGRAPFYKHGITFDFLDPKMTKMLRSDTFIRRWERESKTKVVRCYRFRSVDRLKYLLGKNQPLLSLKCKEFLARIGSAIDAEQHSSSSCLPNVDPDSAVPSAISVVEISTFPDDLCHENLPRDLLFEIFSYLKINEQMRCRRTCRSWSHLLRAWKPSLVQIDLGWLSSNRDHDYFQLAILLDQLVVNTTKSLVLVGTKDFNWSKANIYRIVIDMLKLNELKVARIVICNGSISAREMLSNWRTSYLKCGSHMDGWDVCRKLALVNVMIALPVHNDQRSEGVLMQREIVDKTNTLFEAVMEKLCPELDSASIPKTESRLESMWEKDEDTRVEISLILKAFQVGDSRFTPALLSSQGDFVRVPILPSVRKLTGKVLQAYSSS